MSDSGKGWLTGVPILLALLVLGFVVAPLFRPRASIHHNLCPNNLHQLGLAVGSYTHEHRGRFPDPDNWPEQTLQYVKNQGIYRCPKADYHGLRKHHAKCAAWEGDLLVTYAMNERLRGLSVKDVKKPEETVLLFESNGQKLCGGPELLPKEIRHDEKRYVVIHDPYINVLFADLHVKRIPLGEVKELKWDPK